MTGMNGSIGTGTEGSCVGDERRLVRWNKMRNCFNINGGHEIIGRV